MKRLFVITVLAAFATAAQAQQAAPSNVSASKTTATGSNATALAVGAQSSTTLPLPQEKKDAKKWSLSLVSQMESAFSSMNYANDKDKSFEAINYVGFGYKVAEKTKLGIRQYATFKHAPGKDATTMNNPVLTLTQNMDGVLNSDALAPMFWYYIPTSDASRDVRSNGTLRMDLEVAWTLTPKWTASYLLNPRQSFVPDGVLVAEGKETPVFATTTYIQAANLYYSFTDKISSCATLMLNDTWRTKDMTLSAESLILALSSSFQIGNFNISPEIDVTVKTVSGFARNNDTGPFLAEDNLSYVLTGAYVF